MPVVSAEAAPVRKVGVGMFERPGLCSSGIAHYGGLKRVVARACVFISVSVCHTVRAPRLRPHQAADSSHLSCRQNP